LVLRRHLDRQIGSQSRGFVVRGRVERGQAIGADKAYVRRDFGVAWTGGVEAIAALFAGYDAQAVVLDIDLKARKQT